MLILVAAFGLRFDNSRIEFLTETAVTVCGGYLLLKNCWAALQNKVFLIDKLRTLAVAISKIVLYLRLVASWPQGAKTFSELEGNFL